MIVSLFAAIGGTITFENPGIRLELFLKELTKQTGTEFKCTTYLKDEVLAASFQDQSVDIVKTQLARVIHGTWEKKDDGWWLVQSAEQKKEEAKWNVERSNNFLKLQIDKLSALAPTSDWAAKDVEKYLIDSKDSRRRTGEGVWTFAQREALRFRSPDSRFAEGIAKLLKPEMFYFDNLSVDLRHYSPSGFKGHTRLPIEPSDILRRFGIERDQFNVINNADRAPYRPTNLEISFLRNEVPILKFDAFDEKWRHVQTSYAAISVVALPKVRDEVFPVSNEVKALVELRTSIERSRQDREAGYLSPLFQLVDKTFRNANQTDPLGLLTGRYWVDFAHSANRPMLANLMESLRGIGSEVKVPATEQPVGAVLGMKRLDNDGWILGAPSNPLYNRTKRVDRSMASELYDLMMRERSLSPQQYIRAADLWSNVLTFTEGVPESSFFNQFNRDVTLYGILGTASANQIEACLRGIEIPFSQLPERGQTYAKVMLSDGKLTSLSPMATDVDANYCPSVALPNGIAGMTLSAALEVEYEFSFAELLNEDFDGDSMSLEEFAKQIKRAIAKGSSLLDKKLIYSKNQRLTVRVRLGERSLSDSNPVGFNQDETRYTWKTLPDSIKNVVIEKMKTLPP